MRPGGFSLDSVQLVLGWALGPDTDKLGDGWCRDCAHPPLTGACSLPGPIWWPQNTDLPQPGPCFWSSLSGEQQTRKQTVTMQGNALQALGVREGFLEEAMSIPRAEG